MSEMTQKEKTAYEWALKQNHDDCCSPQGVCRILADYITRIQEESVDSNISQVIRADPGSVVQGVRQSIIKR